MNRRGRIGRGGRIIIDRLPEPKPLFGDGSHEIYRGNLPMTAVRYTTRRPVKEDSSHVGLNDLMSTDMESVIPVAPVIPSLPEFNRGDPVQQGQKRSYQDMMPNEVAMPYCNIEGGLLFNSVAEFSVRVETMKRLMLNRNTTNDQVQFFL